MPANVPGLPPGSLLELDGGVAPFPLTEGHDYVHRTTCGETIRDRGFIAEPSQPLPTRAGKLSVIARGRGRVSVPDPQGTCYSDLDAAYVRIAFDPDPALVPFLGATSWRLDLGDDFTWVDLRAGAVLADGGDADATLRHLSQVHSLCARTGRDPGAPAGRVVARLHAFIPGHPPLTPAETEVDLDCGVGCSCGATSPGVFVAAALMLVLRRRRRAARRTPLRAE